MNVVIVHEQHGAKVAVNEVELQNDLKNGWVKYNADESPQEKVSGRGRRKSKSDTEDVPESPSFLQEAGAEPSIE
jgi:hypothetical protein